MRPDRLIWALSLALSPGIALAQGSVGVTRQPGETHRLVASIPISLAPSGSNQVLGGASGFLPLPPGSWICGASIILTGAGTSFPSVKALIFAPDATQDLPNATGQGQSSVSDTTGVGGVIPMFASFSIPNTLPFSNVFVEVAATYTGTAPTATGEMQCVRL